MDDREIKQWDNRLGDQVRRGWDNYKHLHIDLSAARIDQSYLMAGEYLYVENASSDDAIAKIRLNRKNNDQLDLEDGVKIETVFIEIFISNDALEDEWLDLVFGINFKYKKKDEGGGGGLIYYDRGDIAGHDWTLADFTRDNTWYDLDLSGIIPAGTVLVRLLLAMVENGGSQYGQFRTNGYVNLINIENRITQVANVFFITTLWLYPDANGVIEYRFSNAVWATINVSIAGWFV